jgi:predicted ArsR family transcriptional regulator
MSSHLDSQDRDCLDQLRRSNGGSVHDLCIDFGVTATAIRQRLSRLLQKRLVTREAVRLEGRGRPRHVYHVTDRGLKELGNNYGDLARILWSEVNQIDDAHARKQVTDGVRRALVNHYSSQVGDGPVADRFVRLAEVLTEGGYDVELDERDGLPVLRETNCPFPELAACDPDICNLEQDVFSEVLGTPLELTSCWRDGESYCEFESRPEQLPADAVLLK